MAIVYTCKHCHKIIGELDAKVVDTTTLGWDQLTAEEQQAMIHYEDNGQITVRIICENCERTLLEHPEYHALDYFIH